MRQPDMNAMCGSHLRDGGSVCSVLFIHVNSMRERSFFGAPPLEVFAWPEAVRCAHLFTANRAASWVFDMHGKLSSPCRNHPGA